MTAPGGPATMPAEESRSQIDEQPIPKLGGPTYKQVKPKTYQVLEEQLQSADTAPPAAASGTDLLSHKFYIIILFFNFIVLVHLGQTQAQLTVVPAALLLRYPILIWQIKTSNLSKAHLTRDSIGAATCKIIMRFEKLPEYEASVQRSLNLGSRNSRQLKYVLCLKIVRKQLWFNYLNSFLKCLLQPQITKSQ